VEGFAFHASILLPQEPHCFLIFHKIYGMVLHSGLKNKLWNRTLT